MGCVMVEYGVAWCWWWCGGGVLCRVMVMTVLVVVGMVVVSFYRKTYLQPQIIYKYFQNYNHINSIILFNIKKVHLT